MKVLRVGTRGSKLALKQTEVFLNTLKDKLAQLGEDRKYTFEVRVIKTKGDKILDSPLSKIPGKGFFVKEIEEELLRGNIDFAVHSLKDMPTEMPEGLEISSFLRRDTPADATVGMTLEEIKRKKEEEEKRKDGAFEFSNGRKKIRVGTSSLRREIQLKEMFGDKVEVLPLRGNLDTRIRKLDDGMYDCIVVAYCGLLRLGLQSRASEVINPREFLYAPGQGIIAVETRESGEAKDLAKLIDDAHSRFLGTLERKVVQEIGGGCNTPFGICTEIESQSGKNSIFIKFFGYKSGRKISYESRFVLSSDYLSDISGTTDHILSIINQEI